MKESSALAASGRVEVVHTPAEKTVTHWISGGSKPITSMPGIFINSLNCWKPSSASPRATRTPTGMPGGALMSRSETACSMPHVFNRLMTWVPLGPVE